MVTTPTMYCGLRTFPMARKTNRPPGETPPPAEFGQLRSLAARNGLSQQQIIEAKLNLRNGRSRRQIADDWQEWLSNL